MGFQVAYTSPKFGGHFHLDKPKNVM